MEQKIYRMSADQMRAALISLAQYASEPNYTATRTDYGRGYRDGVDVVKDIIIDRIEAQQTK
jgi:hypothetical protein